jgi:N-acetylmuramoyl-L-alanine amidase
VFIVLKIKRVYIVLVFVLFIFLIFTYVFRDNLREYLKISYKKYYNIKINNEEIENMKNNLNIIDIDFNWTEELTLDNKPNKIIYHHSARSEWSPEEVNEFHKSKGWKGIGYNFYIRKDGTIYSGRPENAEGAHTRGENNNSIGICLEGNFEEEGPSKAQIDSLVNLSLYISLKYDIYKIMGHKDVYETLCPGRNFPIDEIRDKVINFLKNSKKEL